MRIEEFQYRILQEKLINSKYVSKCTYYKVIQTIQIIKTELYSIMKNVSDHTHKKAESLLSVEDHRTNLQSKMSQEPI